MEDIKEKNTLSKRYGIGKVIVTVMLVICVIAEVFVVGLRIMAFTIDPGAASGMGIYISILVFAIAICIFAFLRHLFGKRIRNLENK